MTGEPTADESAAHRAVTEALDALRALRAEVELHINTVREHLDNAEAHIRRLAESETP